MSGLEEALSAVIPIRSDARDDYVKVLVAITLLIALWPISNYGSEIGPAERPAIVPLAPFERLVGGQSPNGRVQRQTV